MNLVLVGFVEFCELAAEFVFGDIGSVWVEDITETSKFGQLAAAVWLGVVCEEGNGRHIHDHLPSAEQLVADEFTGSQGDGRLSVCHIGGCDGYNAVDDHSLSTDRNGALKWMERALRNIRDLDDFEVQNRGCLCVVDANHFWVRSLARWGRISNEFCNFYPSLSTTALTSP